MIDTLSDLGDATKATERRWRRRSLWSLPFLLPMAALVLGYEHLYWLWHGNIIIAREVVAGETASFGGSEWRLVDIATRTDLKPKRIPPGFTVVVVDLSAKVGTAKNILKVGDFTLEQLWGACKIGLMDPEGRRWDASYLGNTPALYPTDNKLIGNCGSHSQSMAPPETVLTVRETFLVPRNVAGTVRPTVSLDGEQPFYLLFQRPPAAN